MQAQLQKQIVIDPITRIEGHSKITIQLDDAGQVTDALFHVTQFRGFEKLCEGRPFQEMPSLMARICGICPVSHLIASAKACDMLMAVNIPETGKNLRRIVNLAQLVQSHALSFFYLASPDLLLGMEAEPASRNLFGVMQANPEFARDGVALRKFGQQIIEWLAGKRIHSPWIVAGGMSQPISAEVRDRAAATVPEAIRAIMRSLEWFKEAISRFRDEIAYFANFPSMFLGLVTPDGALEHYDGELRLISAEGHVILEDLRLDQYQSYIAEAPEPWSYLKFAYFKPAGYPNGIYRVGPLARLNLATRCGTPLADAELLQFRRLAHGPVLSSFHYHYARLIEMLYAAERIGQLLEEPGITDEHVRAFAAVNQHEGIGVSEAPRGTLLHHYKVDDQGLITSANLIIATGHNNLAMSRGIAQAAKHYVKGGQITDGMLNRVEAVIRAYDPCLSCSTHAAGQMPLHVELIGPDGALIDEARR